MTRAGLIEFIESSRTLEDYAGADAVKKWLRGDLELWRQGETDALPMGYLFCGPVGNGARLIWSNVWRARRAFRS